MDRLANIRALKPTPPIGSEPAPGLDPPIVSSSDSTSAKYRILAQTYLQGEPSESDFRRAEIYTALANAAATSELAAASSELATATAPRA